MTEDYEYVPGTKMRRREWSYYEPEHEPTTVTRKPRGPKQKTARPEPKPPKETKAPTQIPTERKQARYEVLRKKYHSDPEWRAKLLAGNAERSKKRYATDPEFREAAKMRKRKFENNRTPESRERERQRCKAWWDRVGRELRKERRKAARAAKAEQ